MTNHLCGECEIGGYEGQVELVPPPFLSRADGRGICIDVCLALEISRLWAHGIKTNGCCCGHGKANPFISVAHGFEGSMRDLGYTVQSHPMRPGAGDHFWPKTGLTILTTKHQTTGARQWANAVQLNVTETGKPTGGSLASQPT